MPSLVTHTGVFDRVRWTSADGSFLIATLEDGGCVMGSAEAGELTPGLTYQFYGKWDEHPEHGKRFKFQQFIQQQPHSRDGVVAYLMKYATGVGPVNAARIWDVYGSDSVKVLRTQPEAVHAAIGSLPLDKARQASCDLKAIAQLEDTQIQLTTLFHGRGFPGVLIDECIKKWGILAPARIKRDPFCLLVEGLSGCGFDRCDRLYLDLGLPPGRLKRQLICLWHLLREDSTGHTWLSAEAMRTRLGEKIVGANLKFKKAFALGVRSRWLAEHQDGDGVEWLSEFERAANERFVAAALLELCPGLEGACNGQEVGQADLS